MKKLILLIAAAMTLFVGCTTDKNNNKEVPLSEQIIGRWTVTEYFDASTSTYKSAVGTSYAPYYAELRADKTFTTDLTSGVYILNDKTIVCTYGAGSSKIYMDIVEISGNSGIADLYYSPTGTKTRLKVKK